MLNAEGNLTVNKGTATNETVKTGVNLWLGEGHAKHLFWSIVCARD